MSTTSLVTLYHEQIPGDPGHDGTPFVVPAGIIRPGDGPWPPDLVSELDVALLSVPVISVHTVRSGEITYGIAGFLGHRLRAHVVSQLSVAPDTALNEGLLANMRELVELAVADVLQVFYGPSARFIFEPGRPD